MREVKAFLKFFEAELCSLNFLYEEIMKLYFAQEICDRKIRSYFG